MDKFNNKLIMKFLIYFDGISNYVEEESKVSTYQLGLCDLKQIDEKTLEVTLRRPGLLIGKGGEEIDKLEKYLDCKIKIIEKIF